MMPPSPRQAHRALGFLSALALAACGGGGGSPSSPASVSTPSQAAARPSIVFLLTDDLDAPSAERMPRLQQFAQAGLTFTRFYAAEPLCGPSRASILTGQYAHNNGVLYNEPPGGGFPALQASEASTIATWLKGAGYRTSLVGKYINAYARGAGDGYIPPGWDDWHGHLSALEDGRYFDYWTNDNGIVTRRGSFPQDYSADVETQQAVSFIEAQAGKPEPIFLYLAPEAPHVPSKYAERHGSEFRYELAPRVPSFNESDSPDMASAVRGLPRLSPAAVDQLDELQRWRLRSLRSVEDMLDAVTQALSRTGRLENTYVIFTSDNGLLMGQHRGVAVKGNFYEEAIRVPFYVRGPGVPVGTTDALAVNVDLAPTFAELAGLPAPERVDGRSLAPLLRGKAPPSWRTDVYLENYAGPDQTYALRSAPWLYCEGEEVDVYDMLADPYQMKNLRRLTSPGDLDAFHRRALAYSACRGASCRS
jgi:N-acetylglucosamine-6-sulfatase